MISIYLLSIKQVKGEFTGKATKNVKAEGLKPGVVYELNDDELLYGGDQTPASMASVSGLRQLLLHLYFFQKFKEYAPMPHYMEIYVYYVICFDGHTVYKKKSTFVA